MVSMRRGCLRIGEWLLALAVICLLWAAEAGAQQRNRHLVLIDPGHGGEDGGVVTDQRKEKDLTLKIALLMREELKKTDPFQVELTRTTDKTLKVADRIKMALEMRPDCLVSLHANAGFGKKAAGYEVYFPGFKQPAAGGGDSAPILKDMVKTRHLNDAVRLAQNIQAGLETVFPRKGRGLREAPIPLLEGLAIPSLVVEVGFMTTPEERRKLEDGETERALARVLLKGLRDYFQKTP